MTPLGSAGNPNLWYFFAGLFALVGVIHLLRALKAAGSRRNAGFAMAGASVVWGITALILRFWSVYQAMMVAFLALGLMLLAAVYSGRLK